MSSKASRIVIGVSFGIVAFVLLCIGGVALLRWSDDPNRLLSVNKRDAQEGAKFRLPPSATNFHATQTQGKDPEFHVTFDMNPKDLPAFWASTPYPNPTNGSSTAGSTIETRFAPGTDDGPVMVGQHITVDKTSPQRYHVDVTYAYW